MRSTKAVASLGVTHREVVRTIGPRGLSVVAIVLAATLACGDGDDDRGQAELSDGGGPVVESVSGPPGTPLPDGFVVAEGTVLIGGAVPTGISHLHNGEPVIDDGWTALLVADGDAPGVVADYVSQGEAQGLIMPPVPEPVTEDGEPIVIGPPGHRFGLCAGGVEGEYICSAHLRSPDRSSPRSLSIGLTRAGSAEAPLSHVVLTYGTTDLAWDHGGSPAFGDPRAHDPGPPQSWPALPAPGERFGHQWRVLGDLTVEEGSRVAGPIYADSATSTLAVLEVTGDPDTVLEAYRDQLEREVGEASDITHLDVDPDTTLDTVRADEVGGRSFTVKMVRRGREPALLAIMTSYD